MIYDILGMGDNQIVSRQPEIWFEVGEEVGMFDLSNEFQKFYAFLSICVRSFA